MPLQTTSPSKIHTYLRTCPHRPLSPTERAELFHQAPQAGTSAVTSPYGITFVQQHAQAIQICNGKPTTWYYKYAPTNQQDGYGVIKATKTRLSLYKLPT